MRCRQSEKSLASPSFILSRMTGKNSCAVALPGSHSRTVGGKERRGREWEERERRVWGEKRGREWRQGREETGERRTEGGKKGTEREGAMNCAR